jgi:hypothetical protein
VNLRSKCFIILIFFAIFSASFAKADCQSLFENESLFDYIQQVLLSNRPPFDTASATRVRDELKALGVQSELHYIQQVPYVRILPGVGNPLGRLATHSEQVYDIPFLLGSNSKTQAVEANAFVLAGADPKFSGAETWLFAKPLGIVMDLGSFGTGDNIEHVFEGITQHEFLHAYVRTQFLKNHIGAFNGVLETHGISGYPMMALDELPAHLNSLSADVLYAQKLELLGMRSANPMSSLMHEKATNAVIALDRIVRIVKRQSENIGDVLRAIERSEPLVIKHEGKIAYLEGFKCPSTGDVLSQILTTDSDGAHVLEMATRFYQRQQAMYAALEIHLRALNLLQVEKVFRQDSRFLPTPIRLDNQDINDTFTALKNILPKLRKVVRGNL